jgi:hypothetical protein
MTGKVGCGVVEVEEVVVSMARCFLLGRASSVMGSLDLGRLGARVVEETTDEPWTGGPEMGVAATVLDVVSMRSGLLAE